MAMSGRVKIGGIGKNPAIDKINSLKAIDIKNHAVRRMEQAVQDGHAGSGMAYRKEIPVSLERVEWEGKPDGQAITGEAGISCGQGDREDTWPCLSGERTDTGQGTQDRGRKDRMVLLYYRRDQDGQRALYVCPACEG